MTIRSAGPAGVLLSLTPADLALRSLTPASLTAREAARLIALACAQAHVTLSAPLEIEAYPSPLGLLLFAHGPSLLRVRRSPRARPRLRRPHT